MSLSGVITRFKTGTYVVTRAPASTYVNGRLTPGSSSTINVDASIQPTTGRDLEVLAEAQITAESRALWTKTQLFARTPTNEPDIVTIDGEPWTVVKVFAHGVLGDPFWRALIARRAMV